jgi:hypothetical protein
MQQNTGAQDRVCSHRTLLLLFPCSGIREQQFKAFWVLCLFRGPQLPLRGLVGHDGCIARARWRGNCGLVAVRHICGTHDLCAQQHTQDASATPLRSFYGGSAALPQV